MDTLPETERDQVAETLHGQEIGDPYRWLEVDQELDRWTLVYETLDVERR